MRVAVIGSRNCEKFQLKDILSQLPENCSVIISGGARGVDTLAQKAAEQLGIPCEEYLPDYDAYGKRAPLVRNETIVRKADQVLAFWDFQSRGTSYTIAKCIEWGIPVQVIGPKD